jgi:hypothetical protein
MGRWKIKMEVYEWSGREEIDYKQGSRSKFSKSHLFAASILEPATKERKERIPPLALSTPSSRSQYIFLFLLGNFMDIECNPAAYFHSFTILALACALSIESLSSNPLFTSRARAFFPKMQGKKW